MRMGKPTSPFFSPADCGGAGPGIAPNFSLSKQQGKQHCAGCVRTGMKLGQQKHQEQILRLKETSESAPTAAQPRGSSERGWASEKMLCL